MSDEFEDPAPVLSAGADDAPELGPEHWWINRGDNYWKLPIEKVEKHYEASYIGHFCVRNRSNQWSETPVATFFVEFPKLPEHSNYFGLFRPPEGGLMICNAISVTEGNWPGVRLPSGEIIYSRFRHDYRHSTDGSIFVDGGRDYLRSGGTWRTWPCRLSIIRDKIVVNDTLFFPMRDC